jgi:hypothetical protein
MTDPVVTSDGFPRNSNPSMVYCSLPHAMPRELMGMASRWGGHARARIFHVGNHASAVLSIFGALEIRSARSPRPRSDCRRLRGDSEPIVCTPTDAIVTFRKSGIDALFMDDVYLTAEA